MLNMMARDVAFSKSGEAESTAARSPSSQSDAPAIIRLIRKTPRQGEHAVTYAGLLLFSLAIFYKPQESLPALLLTPSLLLAIGVLTIVSFLVTQLRLEGRITARPRELDFLLLLCLAGLLSIPLAINRPVALSTFNGMFIKAALIFIGIINVVRTEKRLKGLLLVALSIGGVAGASALNNHRLGLIVLDRYRTTGNLGGVLQDPNDMALFLVTLIPLAIALMCTTRNVFYKCLYGVCVLVMVGGTVVTYSRGGFLGLVAMGAVLLWKLVRRDAPLGIVVAMTAILALALLAPAHYAERLGSISDSRDDASVTQRREILQQSLEAMWQHPIFGVGMGCFAEISVAGKVTHNAYTQVAAEMGLPALAAYLAFILVPLGRLRRIERETLDAPEHRNLYYLAVGLQAALIGYLVSSFFLAVAYYWFIYYLIGYAVCLRRIYETGTQRRRSTLQISR
jgi:putative inorganic carbon (HCO3(-)) transporter